LTREALAQAARVELVLHPESLEHIRSMFASRKRVMPERNQVQAMLPTGAEALVNRCGTAPGIWMRLGDAWVAAMPGVPSEMFVMFEEQVKPRLAQLGMGGGVLVQRKINCFGAGESAVEEKVADMTKRGHVPDVGITVHDATISLRILAQAVDLDAARAQIEPVEKTIRARLGELVFGAEDEDLHDVVVRLLAEKRQTIATAESVTGGLLAQRLTTVPGSSSVFLGGVVAYDNRLKTELLGVLPELIAEHGAVSPPVVEAMAVGCRTRFRTDLALSTVGIAGPGGASADKPVGTVFIALATAAGVSTHTWSWIGTRTEVQSRTAKLALNRARLHLLKK
jgi:nicotinamide-nucleotide amidase